MARMSTDVNYEDYYWEVTKMPMKNPSHPGCVVRHAIVEGLGLSATEAAQALGVSRKQLSANLNGRAGISPDMGVRLEKAIGSSASAWLRMQMVYDLTEAQSTAGRLRIRKLEAAD